MKTTSKRLQHRTCAMGAIGFALTLLLTSAQTTRAQWTSSSGNTTTSDKVGIGSTTPTAQLSVAGSSSNPSLTTDTAVANIKSSSTVELSFGGLASSPYSFWMQTKRSPNDGYSYPLIFNPLGGNIGIGTTSPAFKLHVFNGASSVARIRVGGDGSASNLAYNIALDSTTGKLQFEEGTGGSIRMTLQQDGNVGIGTTSPTAKLDVAGTINTGTAGSGSRINGIGPLSGAGIWVQYTDGSAYYDAAANMYLRVNGNSSPATAMTLNTSGNVGIGTTSPGQKLDVVGNINVSGAGAGNITLTGTINAKYQDVAEWVPSSEQLSAGTVVVLDSTKSNQVTSSATSYDTRVAGVVSEQPGIALGEKSDTKVLVATTGRVRVKVDASKGAIHIGDLLVTSDIPGVAMKSEPVNLGGVQIHRPGTLIGKALEPLEKGKGEILVLLSLQ